MEILKTIIRNIIVIIILASFLEMLLPSSSMKRYVKLVMGLFIIITILSPILSLVDKKYSFELGNYQVSTYNTDDILKKANAISQDNKQRAKEEYQIILAKQIQGIAQLNDGLKVVDAHIKLKETNQNSNIAAGIDEVTLIVNKEKKVKNENINDNTNSEIKYQSNKDSIIKTVQPVRIQVDKIDNNLLEGGKSIERLTQKEKEKIITTIANIYNLTEKQIKIIEKNN